VTDYTPPRVLAALAQVGTPWKLQAQVADESGVAQVWFTFFTPQGLFSVPLERVAHDITGQMWTGSAEVPVGAGYMVQAVDTAGNVRLAVADKGSFTSPNYRLYLSLVLRRK